MKKLILITLIISYLFISCSSSNTDNNKTSSSNNKEILVLAAASLTDVLTELANNYKTETGTIVTFSFASSGALQSQIESGAPADIFFSAAQKQMDALQEKDLIDTNTRKDLLENKVVLIAPSNSKLNIKSFTDITNADVSKVGLGEPKSVPVGQYSEEILSNLFIIIVSIRFIVVGGSSISIGYRISGSPGGSLLIIAPVHYRYGGYGVSFLDIDQAYALRGPSGQPYIGNLHPDGKAGPVYDHKVVTVRHVLDGHKASGLVCDVQCPDSLASAVRGPVFLIIGTFSVTVLAHYEYGMLVGIVSSRIIAYHADNLVVIVQIDAADSCRRPSERPCIGFHESCAAALSSGKENLA